MVFFTAPVSTGFNAGGTIYRRSIAGDFTILHEFSGFPGTSPRLFLESADGNFYGDEALPKPSVFRINSLGEFSYVGSRLRFAHF